MILTVDGKDYWATMDAEQASYVRAQDATTIVIPADLRMPQAWNLTLLAIGAIAKFTPEPHDVLVVDTGRTGMEPGLLIPGGGGGITILPHCRTLTVRTRLWPWYSRATKHGSFINGVAMALAVEYLRRFQRGGPPRHVFFMHNDALPIREGWLGYLTSKLIDGTIKCAGVKPSERNGAPHPSGALYDFGWLANLGPEAMLPQGMWDAGEWPGSRRQHLTAISCTWRPAEGGIAHVSHRAIIPRDWVPTWLADTPVDLSFDDDGQPFYLHRGGGSWMTEAEARTWCALARKALGLSAP